jgi:5-methylthioribose kinase
MYEPLTVETALEYVKNSPLMDEFFQAGDTLRCVDLAAGNVNLIFRVFSEEDPDRTVLLKQALPHARRYPDFKMPLDRARIEHELLTIETRYCPELVPKVYHYDGEMYLNIMEDLNKQVIMREGLMKQVVYPLFAEHIGTFLARTLFYTSDLYLASDEKKAMVPKTINPVLCKVTEDLVFTEPYMEHPNNRWTRLLDPQVEAIRADDSLRAEMLALKEQFMTHAQALIHGDLHTGSIMLNQEETKVIDPEFGFFGPMGFDIGAVLGNLMLAYASQEYHAKDEVGRASYRKWLLETLRAVWQVLEAEFRRLWDEEGNDYWPSATFRENYILQLLRDTAGFGAAKMMRRVLGLAHVEDLEEIPDEHVKAIAESLALNIAQSWVMNRHTIISINDMAQMAADARPSYPFE